MKTKQKPRTVAKPRTVVLRKPKPFNFTGEPARKPINITWPKPPAAEIEAGFEQNLRVEAAVLIKLYYHPELDNFADDERIDPRLVLTPEEIAAAREGAGLKRRRST